MIVSASLHFNAVRISLRKSMDTVAHRVALLLQGHQTQALVKLTGFSDETVRRYRLGTSTPNIAFVMALVEGLGVNGHWVLTGTPPIFMNQVVPLAVASAGPSELVTELARRIRVAGHTQPGHLPDISLSLLQIGNQTA